MLPFLTACSSASKTETGYKTVEKLELSRFMGRWYVLAGRFTSFEKEVHNAVETYTWNEKKERIDIGFTYNKGSLEGPVKSIPQKGWVYNTTTNSHWKVSPFWPLKFDYLVVGLAPDYSWTAIGVPNGDYLWIMARSPESADQTVDQALSALRAIGYPTQNLVRVPHGATSSSTKSTSARSSKTPKTNRTL